MSNFDSKWTNPPVKQIAVTKSDSTIYEPPLVALWVGTTGDLNLVLHKDDGAIGVTKNVPVGLFRGRIKQVLSTSTTASDLLGYPYDDSTDDD